MTAPNENGSATPEQAQADPAAAASQGGRKIAMALAAASVLLAVWVAVKYLTADSPGGGLETAMTYWRCQNETCGKGFQMSRAELLRTVEEGPPGGEPPKLTLAELNAQSVCGLESTPLWCPHCGSYLIAKAFPCPHCGGMVATGRHGVMPDSCDLCGADPSNPDRTAEVLKAEAEAAAEEEAEAPAEGETSSEQTAPAIPDAAPEAPATEDEPAPAGP